MIFEVDRASNDILENNKPCDNAVNIFREKSWIIEIDSLEDLISFIDKHGRIIIENSCNDENIKRITIYDDYIE